MSINLQLPARPSPNAVRILALAPPGESGYALGRKIREDVATQRQLELWTTVPMGREGALFSIFSELWETIQPSASMWMSSDIQNRPAAIYAASFEVQEQFLEVYILVEYAMECNHILPELLFQHTVVRDCGASKETLRLARMKLAVSNSSTALPKLSTELFNVKESIRRTAEGASVVSHFFDPYRASLFAPDHLLTGHFRDCAALSLRLLPTQKYIESFENCMLGLLKDA